MLRIAKNLILIVLLKDYIQISFKTLKDNSARSVITILIIAFGIMALVGILTAIDGMKTYLNKDFSSMGANTVKIRNQAYDIRISRTTKPPKRHRPIQYKEALQFQKEFSEFYPVSVQAIGNYAATLNYKKEETNPNIMVIGSDQWYAVTEGYEILHGRNIQHHDLEKKLPVAVLGNEVAATLFDKNIAEAVGKTIQIDKLKFQVIGVFKEKGTSLLTTDKFCIIPISKAKDLYLYDETSYIISIMTENPEQIEEAMSTATPIMRLARKLKPQDENNFAFVKSDSISALLTDQLVYVRIGGFIIGLITLIGAAIGLMNIMLVSIKERTREIGTLKAIGARKKDILSQFLTEAVLLCQLGGGLGILLGIIIGNVVSIIIGGSFIIPWAWILLGVGVCLIVGVISGIYPAIKAANQDPIEALRYE